MSRGSCLEGPRGKTIRWRGEVLGFSERISWKGEGLLRLEGEALSFSRMDGPRGFLVSIRGVELESHTGGGAPVPELLDVPEALGGPSLPTEAFLRPEWAGEGHPSCIACSGGP